MKIRVLKLCDIGPSSEIVGLNYSKKDEKMSFREMEAMFKNYVIKPQYMVAEEKGEILGVAGYIQSWMDYDIYNIFWVNVSPAYHGQGIGTALVQRIINIIKKKKARMILLTASKPEFYSKKFKFEILSEFKSDKYALMALKLKD